MDEIHTDVPLHCFFAIEGRIKCVLVRDPLATLPKSLPFLLAQAAHLRRLVDGQRVWGVLHRAGGSRASGRRILRYGWKRE
jgi:hypothetical protein